MSGIDVHPAGMGGDAFDFVRAHQKEILSGDLKDTISNIKLVKPGDTVSDADRDRLRAAGIKKYGFPDENTWGLYQIDLNNFLEAGVIVDAKSFAAKSIYCEFGYVINLDTNIFEIYRGFIESPHDEGVFADIEPHQSAPGSTKYYPIRLKAVIPIKYLPSGRVFSELCVDFA